MPQGEEMNFVPRDIERINDPPVAYTQTKAIASGHAVVRKRSKPTSHLIQLRLDPLAQIIRQFEKNLIER